MSKPYRTDDGRQRPDAVLQQLARRGAQRRNSVETAAAAERESDSYRHLRIAIGSYRGSAMKRTVLAIVTVGSLVGIASVLVAAPVLAVAVISLAITGLLVALVVIPPLASESAIAAEERWVGSLPFQLEGYFELLSATPEATRTILYDVSWLGDQAPDTTLFENVVAAIDPKARVEQADARGARIVSGPVSGITSMKRSSRSYVTTNHGIPPSVHTLLEQVLVSLHRSYPLERVSLTSR